MPKSQPRERTPSNCPPSPFEYPRASLRPVLHNEREYLQWWSAKNAARGTQNVSLGGITISVNKNVFCPDPEMTHLPVLMMDLMPNLAGKRVLDVGTGSGILALYAAQLGAAEVIATDIDPFALKNARENVAKHGLEHVVHVQHSDMFDDVSGKFDVIIANLPILDSFWSDKTGPVADVYQRFIAGLQDKLTANGIALLGFASFGDMNAVKELILPAPLLSKTQMQRKFGTNWYVFQFDARCTKQRSLAHQMAIA